MTREEATQECIVGGSILRCYCKQKLVRPMCSLSTIRDGHHELNRVKFPALAAPGFFITRFPFSLVFIFVSRFFDRALRAATSSNRPCRSCARCIARSDGLDPIEPLRTTVESYPEMVGIDVTVALLSSSLLPLSLSLFPFLALSLFLDFISFHAKR